MPKHGRRAESPATSAAQDTPAAADEMQTRDRSIDADWEQTFDAVTDPMALLTPDYHVIRANAAYLAWMHTTRGRCEGHECFIHADRLEGPCAHCPLPRTVATGQPGFVRQVRMQPDGASGALVEHIYETWTYPIKGEQDVVERVVEIVKDVTERERLQQLTNEAQALREAERLKAELLGTVSHELRSPLATIKGYAATLLKYERRLSAAERREFLRAIVEASDRLESVIDSMLEMSQLDSGAVRLDGTPVDIERLAREAVGAAASRASMAHPQQFSFTLDSQFALSRGAGAREKAEMAGPVIVQGDARRLRSLLDHLLENAVKYSPHGGAIAVTLRPYQAPTIPAAPDGSADESHDGSTGDVTDTGSARMVELLVQDAGIGIPPDQLNLIFNRFHRVDTGLTRESDGLGLGLSIAKRIVELHGGSIRAENVAEGGTVFHIVLPLTPVEREVSVGTR